MAKEVGEGLGGRGKEGWKDFSDSGENGGAGRERLGAGLERVGAGRSGGKGGREEGREGQGGEERGGRKWERLWRFRGGMAPKPLWGGVSPGMSTGWFCDYDPGG